MHTYTFNTYWSLCILVRHHSDQDNTQPFPPEVSSHLFVAPHVPPSPSVPSSALCHQEESEFSRTICVIIQPQLFFCGSFYLAWLFDVLCYCIRSFCHCWVCIACYGNSSPSLCGHLGSFQLGSLFNRSVLHMYVQSLCEYMFPVFLGWLGHMVGVDLTLKRWRANFPSVYK